MIRLYLWFCRVLLVARGPWVRAGTRPSLRPLVFEGGSFEQLGRIRAARTRTRVSNHVAARPSRRGLSAAPQDEVVMRSMQPNPHGEEARKRRLEP